MARNESTLTDQEISYFAPGQLAFLVEHEAPLDPSRLVEGLKVHPLVREDERLQRAEFSAERVLTFAPQAAQDEPKQSYSARPVSRALVGRARLPVSRREEARRLLHSILFADLELPDDDLIALVDEMDRRLLRYADPGPGGIVLRALTPNWLSAGAPYHIGTGGPGAQPVPAKLDENAWWRSSGADVEGAPFSFALPADLSKETSPGTGVRVAILDTAPTPEAMRRAYKRWQADHPILRGLLGPTGELPSKHLRLIPGDAALFARLNSEDGGFQLDGHRYDMSDHGLFIAGIIHSIAPDATLTLVRVLNDYGVGTLETITQGLHTVYAQRDRSRPLVVNMSLTLSLPLHGHKLPGFGPARLFADSGFIERMGWPLQWTCDILEDDGVLIVAAAGNDAQPGKRPYARQPAAFDSVIGVGALRKDGKPTDYSNLADHPSPIGIATFGGETSVPGMADPDNGVLGVYIGEFPDGSPNINGWARWAGTSFAAPAITGVLARLRSTVYSPQAALRKVYDAQSDVTPHPALEEILTLQQG